MYFYADVFFVQISDHSSNKHMNCKFQIGGTFENQTFRNFTDLLYGNFHGGITVREPNVHTGGHTVRINVLQRR